jgi:type I restriction enzyme S subunit
VIQENKIPWLKDVNTTWQCFQVKRGFETVLGKMLQPTQRNSNDIEVPYLKALHIHWDGIKFEDLPKMWANQSEIEQLSLKQGDLIVCEGGEVGRGTILNHQLPSNCIIQNSLHRVRNKELGETRFLRYILQSASDIGWLDVLCNRATIRHFTVEKFSEFWIAAPSQKEQKLIADYLDRETTQIDNLIAAKEQMLTLLEEKREALISHAVTRGLDPNVAFKRSGLDWLGDIPQHWNIERAKNLFSVRDERSDSGDEELLSVSHITGVTSRADKQVYMFKAEDMTGYKRCTKGDFVTNTLWGWMGAMGVSPLDGIVSPDYHVYIFKGDLLPEFMELLCRSKPFIAEVVRWSKGVWSSRLRIYPENFFEIRFPVPPKSEQLELIDKVAKEDEKNKELKNALTNSISLLKERRSALITAAVTGQITLEEMKK